MGSWFGHIDRNFRTNSCYCSYQRFWHMSEANGSFTIVLTHVPHLHAKRGFARGCNCNNSHYVTSCHYHDLKSTKKYKTRVKFNRFVLDTFHEFRFLLSLYPFGSHVFSFSLTRAKERFCVRIQFDSMRISSEYQHIWHFFVWGRRQHGNREVMKN